jgi:hypothetical protein
MPLSTNSDIQWDMAPANESAIADGEILGTGVGAIKAFLTDRRAFAVFAIWGKWAIGQKAILRVSGALSSMWNISKGGRC